YIPFLLTANSNDTIDSVYGKKTPKKKEKKRKKKKGKKKKARNVQYTFSAT
ncbi:hypothetical protein C7212DRAFT_328984, partial [Tuber magnatum]